MYKLYKVGKKINESDECKVLNSFEEKPSIQRKGWDGELY
jgi:hypothetical protein